MEALERRTFTATQLEFMAEDEYITIIPTQRLERVEFVREALGPFRAGMPADVPLWYAVVLKKRNKCKIQPPLWLDVESLRQKIHDEMDSVIDPTQSRCLPMPFHYMEIARQLLEFARDDLPNATETRTLLEELITLRSRKIRNSVRSIQEYRPNITLTNLSAMELNQVRPFLTLEMDHLRLLAHPQEEPSVSTPLPGVPSAASATPTPSSSSFVGSGGSGTSVPSSSTTATQPARRNLRPLYIQQEQ